MADWLRPLFFTIPHGVLCTVYIYNAARFLYDDADEGVRLMNTTEKKQIILICILSIVLLTCLILVVYRISGV